MAERHIPISPAPGGIKDPRIAKVEMFVERNLRRNIRLCDAARLASLEKHYFAVLFRRSMGKTFTQWLREKRVHHAVHLLKRRSSSIASIASAVGYRDCTGLARAFREVLGMNPRKVRDILYPAGHQLPQHGVSIVRGRCRTKVIVPSRYDAVLRRETSRSEYDDSQERKRVYGSSDLYAQSKRQLSKREIKAYGLRE